MRKDLRRAVPGRINPNEYKTYIHMNKTLKLLFAALFCLNLSAQNGRTVISMDKDWRFKTGSFPESVNPAFNDTDWRLLDVPHDWSIEGKYNKYNKTGRGGGYLPAGDGWYRKTFIVPASEKSRKIFIQFDGVMANSEVYINGQLLGIQPYGYTSFEYEMTDHILFGENQKNVLVVRANNINQPSSRWYTGAGIYRHTRMVIKNPVHIAHWGVFITTPEVSSSRATVKANVQLENKTDKTKTVTIKSTIVDKTGKEVKSAAVSEKIPANSSLKVNQVFQVVKPVLWSTETPDLYTLVTQVREGKTVLDDETNSFGIRSIRYDAAKGFFLNEKPMKMYGACMHHDGGGVGAAVPLGIWEYRFNKLKEAGINAVRTAHNPMAPEFYDLCDRMGMLVLSENFDTWEYEKNPFDYHLFFNDWWKKDLSAMIMRDRNHPSIVLYSVGNEIRDNLNNETGFRKYRQQQDLIHVLDPSRPVTMALFRPNTSGVYNNGFADMMDVVGQNYRPKELLAAHAQNPKRIVIGTENVHDTESYVALRDNEFMCGQFLWPGFDYLGEALWPQIGFSEGLFDKAGGWRRNGLLRKVLWGKEPAVFVIRRADNAGRGEWVHDWTPMDPITYEEAYLEIFCNADEVELFVNNVSQGVRKVSRDREPIRMNINFFKGELRAEARTNGRLVATEVLKTAGYPYKIMLIPHKTAISNNGEDVSYVKAVVTDENSERVPDADHLIEFTAEGAGKIIATDSGDVLSHQSTKINERNAYCGECYAIVKATENSGKIRISARAEGLEGVAGTEIEVK
ncbi:MAG: sugar-binding domain-containing protein [Paludibacteraceae bacterium]